MALDENCFVKLLCDFVSIDAHTTTENELIDAYLDKLTKNKNPSPKLKRIIENLKKLRTNINKQDEDNNDNEEWT